MRTLRPTSAPADAFPPDSATDGFDNHAQSLTVSPQLASLLLGAAESVAAEALDRDDGRIMSCDPAQAGCLPAILGGLARRVYRRPATEQELAGLEALVEVALEEGESAEGAVEHALAAMLMAPQFLYRGVPVDAGAGTDQAVQPLSDHALATRLSYFLWGSTPDDALLAAADDGILREELRPQFDRMLADPRSEAFFDGFVAQWLQLGRLGATSVEPELREQMHGEVRLFFEELQARDASPIEILTSNETYASEGLADLYGLRGADAPTGLDLEPVSTDPDQRAGVLTMPAVLTMTSGPEHPSIVRRGVWLAESILCAEPPPPPEGVPFELPQDPGLSERERLEAHRTDPSCASCHDLIDPLGFAFEHYDAVGRWRTEVGGEPVDSLGTLPDGRTFADVVELSALLADGPEFAECLTERTFTFALGRTVEREEACRVEAVAAIDVGPDTGLSDLLWAVVTSDAFQTEAAP